MSHVYYFVFSPALCFPTIIRSKFCWGFTNVGNPFALTRMLVSRVRTCNLFSVLYFVLLWFCCIRSHYLFIYLFIYFFALQSLGFLFGFGDVLFGFVFSHYSSLDFFSFCVLQNFEFFYLLFLSILTLIDLFDFISYYFWEFFSKICLT